jgi:hypothetical protein
MTVKGTKGPSASEAFSFSTTGIVATTLGGKKYETSDKDNVYPVEETAA